MAAPAQIALPTLLRCRIMLSMCFASATGKTPRAMTDKLTTVADAVAHLVHDGDYLAIGGFGGDRLPTAICHEILRQGRQRLSVAGHTATHDFQILCAGNMTGRGKTI